MELPWERATQRALSAAEALLRPPAAPALVAAAFAEAPDPAARFDAILASILAGGDGAPVREPEPSAASVAWPETRWNGWGMEMPGIGGSAPMRAASSAGAGSRVPRPAAAPRLSLEDAGAAGVFPAPRVSATSWLSPAPAASSPSAAWDTASGDARTSTPSRPASTGASAAASASPSPFPWSAVASAATTQGDAAIAPADTQWVDAREVNLDPTPFPPRPASAAAMTSPAPMTTRLAASTAELSALLQAQVTPDAAAPAFAAWDQAADAGGLRAAPWGPASSAAGGASAISASADAVQPATHAFDAPASPASPAFGDAASPLTHRFPSADPVAEFEEIRGMGPAEAMAAEEMLVDRILDRLNDRMRDESIRRFGLTGGVI